MVHRLPDGVGTNGVFTEGPYFLTFCNSIALSAHVLPHLAVFCYMLPTFPRESSYGDIAALLRQPRLSRPRLEAGEWYGWRDLALK